ncbi:16S rRNA (guanine(527)-N(7))-methyltransferase RsmG [Micrococcus flavus]|uniref:Ribosomal RNA small subunit methyltransferase G n=1 Tax=Micrococcus flavus TaxID=384602 RepID=A0A4Y8WYI1_9MICC|nr:16S rRNA (guanine(527)-N(7))-methyltransferase RsmG [Micrococcus flavus]MBB4883792.1 16S rRNA (guanine527-N7)-methyltransferase [Micrococcus flavus]TFI00319.1 16S rRNA (guanine(527)-N(7))-methyltransferase RsmG [Micrococcus flavus]GGK47606.1 ribosomal RNA small subunit methyltransferase G [Micrococcus flavus]
MAEPRDPQTPAAEAEAGTSSTSAAPALEATLRPAAERVFGDAVPRAERYVGHLATTGTEWGLLGPREVPRLWERHVLNCAVVAELLPEGALVADVGSGAGLPGLCLALARPDCHFTLIEPLERRVTWLEMVVADLGLTNVEVVRARSEQVADEIQVDVVTARAVSALKTLLPLTMPLLRSSGELLAIKGRSAADEITAAQKPLRKYGCGEPEIVTLGEDLLPEPTTVVRVPARRSR